MRQVKKILSIVVASLVALGAVVLVVYLSSREGGHGEPADTYHSPTLFAMDTTLNITVQGRGTARSKKDVSAGAALARKIERETSRFKPGSDVSRINAQAGVAAVPVSDDTLCLVLKAVDYGRLTGGAFDVTIAPIAQLWGFYDQKYRVPSTEEVEAARGRVDYRRIAVDEKNKTVMLTEAGMQMDLGGIAKGYAVGKICELYRTRGVEHALVNFGGAIGAIGNRSDGEDWVIGIKDPRAGGAELSGELELSDGFVCSSGDYERYFIRGTKRYFHIFDPRTGANPTLAMATTVAGPDPTVTDILSTTLIVMGPSDGMEFMKTQPGYEAILIDSAGKFLFTPNMKSEYEVESKEHL